MMGAASANAPFALFVYDITGKVRVQEMGALGGFVQQIKPNRQIRYRTMRIEDINNS